jgi:Cof subfamily protein (haloacid dehalogenase superfamily)
MINLPEFDKIPAAIALDLDGTLLNSHTELSGRNRAALEACIKHGIPVIIATARAMRTYSQVFPRDLIEKCSYVLMNGSLAVGNPPLTGCYREPLPDGIPDNIVNFALSFDTSVHINVEIDGNIFGLNWHADPRQLWENYGATPDMVISIDEALNQNPCKIAASGADMLVLAERLRQNFGNEISIVHHSGDRPLLNITSSSATKPAALRRLLSPYGITLDRVLAFGDDHPDIGMLKECGMSVAMANARPEVKNMGKYKTASNDDDGVAMVLEKILKFGKGK